MSFDDPKDPGLKYCPQCEGEFVAELETCPDCGVALVAEKPPEPPHRAPVEIFSTTEQGLLGSVRATLTDAEIEFREIERDLSQAIMGAITHETVVLVGEADSARATALLEGLEEGEVRPPY